MGRYRKKKRLQSPLKPKNEVTQKEPSSKKRLPSIPPVLRFVLLFLLSLALLGLAYSHLTAEYHDDLLWLMDATATITGAVLSLFTDDVYYSGKYVTYHGFSVEIIDECTGLLEMVIYLAAVISFSAGIRKKLIGIVAGVPAIYLFNVIRIMVLLIAGSISQPVFDFMHLYFWQATLIIMIATVWISWLYLVVYREKKPVAVSA
ncbi:MAG: exosortase H [bacterium]